MDLDIEGMLEAPFNEDSNSKSMHTNGDVNGGIEIPLSPPKQQKPKPLSPSSLIPMEITTPQSTGMNEQEEGSPPPPPPPPKDSRSRESRSPSRRSRDNDSTRSNSRNRRKRNSSSRSPTHSSSRRRSRSPDRRRRRRSPDRRRRERSISPYRRRSRSRSRDRYSRRRRDGGRRRRSPTPERRRRRPSFEPLPSEDITEQERDKRSVFCMQLAARLRRSELAEFFSTAGEVRDVRIIYDRISGRSKGVGYVEFVNASSVQSGVALTNQKLLGIPIIVQSAEAEKNHVEAAHANLAAKAQQKLAAAAESTSHGYAAAEEQATTVSDPNSFLRLYVGSLPFHLTESDIQAVFEPFGELAFVNLHKDPETLRSKGFAFVQFKKTANAKAALDGMQRFELGGRQIKVNLVTEPTGNAKSVGGGLGGGGQDLTSLEDSDKPINLTSQARIDLMAKLSRGHGDSILPLHKKESTPVVEPVTPAGRCLEIRNVFAQEDSGELDEIEEDVREECQNFGKVVHLYLERGSLNGSVWCKFDSVASCVMAHNKFLGRFFGGKQLGAVYVPENVYSARFTDTSRL